jgi:DNA-binding transcriptional regulator YiaG
MTAPLVDLRSRADYRPDVTSIACRRLASAREQAGMSPAVFAAALTPLIGWAASADLVRQWESAVAAPGQVLAAAEIIAAKAAPQPATHKPVLRVAASDRLEADIAAMRAFRTADLKMGGGRLYGEVSTYLRDQIGPRLLAGPSHAFTAAAAVSEMAGWMAHDAGRDHDAGEHFTRAASLVSVSGDQQVTAHVQASIAHLAHHTGRPADAIRAAGAGRRVITRGPRRPQLEARLLAMQARGHAALRRPTECTRLLTQAERVLGGIADEAVSEWISGFDEGALANEMARCMWQLGDLGEAKRQAERIIALRPASRPRARAFGQYVLACVLITEGDLAEACAVAGQILAATQGLQSWIVVEHLSTLRRMLRPYRADATVAGFLGQLSPALRARVWTGEPA